MSDIELIRQGIRGGPPFSIGGISVSRLAGEALDRLLEENKELHRMHAATDRGMSDDIETIRDALTDLGEQIAYAADPALDALSRLEEENAKLLYLVDWWERA